MKKFDYYVQTVTVMVGNFSECSFRSYLLSKVVIGLECPVSLIGHIRVLIGHIGVKHIITTSNASSKGTV